ncbi:MAG: hypothetical protein WCH04_00635 [Gammaproteobacteria bacterium]
MYLQSCSGWAPDGNIESTESGRRGGGSVCEPTPPVLLAIGPGLPGVNRKV